MTATPTEPSARHGQSGTDLSFLAPPGEVLDWRLAILLDVAVGEGVLSLLPGDVDDIARKRELDPRGVRVVLDALRSWDVVERTDGGSYRLGAAAPDAAATAVIRHHARAIARWSGSVRGRLRGEVNEQPAGIFDPETFLDALAVNARKAAPSLVDLCLQRFPDVRRVIDLGGGHGEYSLEFARRGLEVTMQDLPRMIDIAERRGRLAAAGVELVAGSFFDGVPEGPFDLAFATGIVHTFDGDHNLQLYRNLRPVVTDNGGVAVVTMVRGRNTIADLFAVQMFSNGHGGDTHAEDDHRRWLSDAGFEPDPRIIDLAGRAQSMLFAV